MLTQEASTQEAEAEGFPAWEEEVKREDEREGSGIWIGREGSRRKASTNI